MNFRKIIFLLLITLGGIAFSNAQNTTIYYKDGNTADGFGRLYAKKVKFKSKKKGKWKKLEISDIDSIKHKKKTYIYKSLKKGKKPVRFQVLYQGDHVGVYRVDFGEVSQGIGSIGPVGVFATQKDFEIFSHRPGEEKITLLYSKKMVRMALNYKKRSKKYFSDCPLLVKKIGEKGYRLENFKAIGKYYEQHCSK